MIIVPTPLAALISTLVTQEKPVATVANRSISGQQLATDVLINWQQLQQHDEVSIGIYSSCCYRFTVALFAAIHAKKNLIILPNLQPGFINSLAGDIDRLMLDEDSNISSLPQLTISAFNDCHDTAISLPPINSDAVAISFFTSGSTGTPEKINKTLFHIDAEIAVVAATWSKQLQAGAVFSSVSHQHLYGFLFRLLWPLSTGRFIDMDIYPYPELLLKKLTAYQHSTLISSPALLNRIDKMVDISSLGNNTLQSIFSSGGPLKANAAQVIQQQTGICVQEIFGSTETGAIAYREQQRELGLSTPWIALSDTSLSIDNNSQQLLVRSKHQPGEGWFKMGDTAELLDDGRFLLKSRIDKIVKIEEKRVSLTQINLQLNAHPLVEEAASLVIDNRRRFIAVVAVLSAQGQALLNKSGKLVINNQLRDYLLQFFEAIVLPKKWRFVERLPINNQGKTTHQQLQALFESKQPRIDKPTVTSVKEIQEDIVITLFIPADLYYFNGHFTSKPILAGVVQIDWAIFYGQQHFAINGKFNSMEVIKFHEFIEPESEVELTISYNASKNKLKFQYQSALGRHSSGRIVFG